LSKKNGEQCALRATTSGYPRDRVSVAAIHHTVSMAYDETLRGFAQKSRDSRVISLRIAGKSPWLRDESVTAVAPDAAARRPIRICSWHPRKRERATIRRLG
jgi:hypothetical protein